MTVLFADLKGSMELLAERDPEEARKILDPVLELMMEAVHRYEGTVNQVMGDGIMALFGAPIAHEDHAVRACYAGLLIQESISRYADELRREQRVDVQIRIGMNSGDVVVRSVGSDLRMDYTAVGQTTHLAARMEQLARPGTILLAPATLKLAENFIEVRALGPTSVKGMSAPVDVYELLGATARSRFQALAARGLTEFVSRTDEMAQLVDALQLARDGRGQVAAVVGDPGVGKSRLFWEFTHSPHLDGWLVVEAASVSYGKATVYLPVIELLRGYFQLTSRDDVPTIRDKVAAKLLALDRTLAPSLTAFLALLDVPVADDEAWTRLDPKQRRQRTLDAVKRLLLRESEVQPLVVVFEDLHWIDGETQAVLEALTERLPTARLLLLVNYRPEYHHTWGGQPNYRQLRLDALSVAGAEMLLAALVGTDPSLDAVKRLLVTRTDGNPFFLEESVRALVETHVLDGAAGAYHLTNAPHAWSIPATAQAVLAARIDRLDPDDKRLLQAASVIGKDVPLAILEAIADMPDDELRQRLARLRAADFLYEKRRFPEVDYTFKHALTHEVAYTGLLQGRRRRLHGHIVTVTERLYATRLAEHFELLAHHASKGELWEKTALYGRAAGQKMLGRSANREAIAYFDETLTALDRVTATRQTMEDAIDVRLDMRSPLLHLADYARTRQCLVEAGQLAQTINDERRQAWALAFLCQWHTHAGTESDALACGHHALALAEKLEDVPVRIVALFYLGQGHGNRFGDSQLAVDFYSVAADLVRTQRVSDMLRMSGYPAVLVPGYLGYSLAVVGRFPEALSRAREAVALAEELGHPYTLVNAYWCLGQTYNRQGDFGPGGECQAHAANLAREWDIAIFVEIATIQAQAANIHGVERGAAAIPILEQVVERHEAGRRHATGGAVTLLLLGEAYLINGRIADARVALCRALELMQRGQMGVHETRTLRVLGEAEMMGGGPEATTTAERTLRHGLERASALHNRPEIAHCHRALAKLSWHTGRFDEAKQHFSTATSMYREMGMTYWLEKAEKEWADLTSE